MADNPYLPPETTVADPIDASEPTLVEPKKLPAGRGLGWIQEGFGYFKASPLIWIVNIIIMIALMMLLALIPILGGLASNILSPIFMGGLMLGCAALDQNKPLTVNHLFAGFQKDAGNLALIGLLYLVGMIVIMLIAGLLMMMFGGAGQFTELAAMGPDAAPSPEQMQALGLTGGLAVLVALGLAIPLAMAYYFAPALVVRHNLGAVEAMKLSFKGCLRNIIPFLVYGIVALILAIIATIPFALGWLILAPVLTGAVYAGYKDIFTG